MFYWKYVAKRLSEMLRKTLEPLSGNTFYSPSLLEIYFEKKNGKIVAARFTHIIGDEYRGDETGDVYFAVKWTEDGFFWIKGFEIADAYGHSNFSTVATLCYLMHLVCRSQHDFVRSKWYHSQYEKLAEKTVST